MSKIIQVRKTSLFMAVSTVLTVLFLLTTPVTAAETPQQQLERAKNLSDEATVKATLALETGDLALAQEAQLLADEAAGIIAAVTEIAADTGDTELAQAALNASIGVGEATNIIVGAAETIAATSTDTATVEAATALATTAATTAETTTTTQETAMATGASMAAAEEAYEPPADTPAAPPTPPPSFDPPVAEVEPPITDVSPASEV
jgi:hypothetical protein